MAKKIEKGKVPRGRTALPAVPEEEFSSPMGTMTMAGSLSAKVIRKDGREEDLGVVSTKLVTQAFAEYLVDAMQNSSSFPMDAFKYHASGTLDTPESNTQTALANEVESRVIGTQTEGASANVYKTEATITYSGSYAIVEHGLFSAPTGGIMCDRGVFGAINVSAGDSIKFTYTLTVFPES